VAITSENTGLLIGMNVRLNYIVDEATHVLTVPYEAVYTNAAGASCVLAAMPQAGSDKHILQEFVVETGLETDIAVVISGPDIVSGLRVINTPTSYQAGQEVTISEKGSKGANLNSFGMPVGGYDE
jgi:HlyD family secretion protein